MVKVLKNPQYTDKLSSFSCPLDACQKLKQIWYCHICFVIIITVIFIVMSNVIIGSTYLSGHCGKTGQSTEWVEARKIFRNL